MAESKCKAADEPPKGCARLWNQPCSARECFLPYCREKGFDRAKARAKLAEEKAAVFASFQMTPRNETPGRAM